MKDKKDLLVKRFLEENKKEVADNGFTDKVMQEISDEKDRTWIVLFLGAAGVALSILFCIYSGLLNQILLQVEHIPFYYYGFAVFVFPLIFTLAFCRNGNCSIRHV
ncbi:MAG: DUF5056 domain-containing protein [Paludibacter sp.]|nr:DUF5056 domain-containing protein [Paludibacter sp.]